MLGSWLLAGVTLIAQIEGTAAPQAKTPPQAMAAEPANKEVAASVRKLVVELDAPDKARRDEAERKLLELGPAALDVLPQNSTEMTAEVSLRLERLRTQLQQAAADASVRATHVTIKGQAMPLSIVLADLQRQTGNKLVDFRGRFGENPEDVKLDIDFDKTPFWKALDQIMDQANLTLYDYSGEEGLALVGRSPTVTSRHGRADYVGAFRIEATQLAAHRDLRNPVNDTLQIHLDVSWEPRLRPIVILMPMKELKLTDDQGKPFESDHQGGPIEIPVNQKDSSIHLPLQFELPSRDIKKFSVVKGKLMAMLPGQVESFRFGDLENAKRAEQRKAGVNVVLDQVMKNDALWEFRLRVVFDQAAGALESHRNWVFNNPIWLESPDKEKVSYAGFETTKQTENEVGLSYLFSVDGGDLKGYTLVYQTPAAIANIPIEFTLRDLELP